MGFSVSGSAVLLFAGLLVAFGMWSTAAAQSHEQISEAEHSRNERVLTMKNTAINITDARWNGDAVNFDIENTGSRTLRKTKFSVLIDGSYESISPPRISELVRPGEKATLEVGSIATQPSRLKVVTGVGVSDSTSEVRAV